MSINRENIEARISLMLKYLRRLQQFNLSLDEYLASFDQQLIAERLLQLLVEVASDINSDLLVEIYQDTPETYFDSFIKAGRNGIIDVDLSRQLAQSAGLRNRLVHQYEEIDHQIVFTSISDALQQFSLYIQQITHYLDSLEPHE